MAKKPKFKVAITSDGTIMGTKVTVNGEEVSKTKSITDVSFYANGGIKWSDGDKSHARLSFNYRALNKNDDGSQSGESFSYSPDSGIERGTLNAPVDKPVEDHLLGRNPKVVDTILGYKGKSARFIPSEEELRERTPDSLADMLDDIEKEMGK